MRFLFASGVAALALSACSPTGNTAGGAIGTNGLETVATTEPSSSRAVPEAFSSTAWRAIAEDGARYVTEIDPDGTYRDLRNGDPWQDGAWSYEDGPEAKMLCFTPDDENGVERCWQPGRITDGTLVATNAAGRRIELEPVDYTLPEDNEDDGGA